AIPTGNDHRRVVSKHDLRHGYTLLSWALGPAYGPCNAIAPVSSSDFRFDRTFGQPPDTLVISFESTRSLACVIVSLTAPASCSSSIVQRESPSALSSGLFS